MTPEQRKYDEWRLASPYDDDHETCERCGEEAETYHDGLCETCHDDMTAAEDERGDHLYHQMNDRELEDE